MAIAVDYDVAISYAARDRTHAEALAAALKLRKVKVFYDRYEQSSLWGQNLYTVLSDLYSNRAKYCVMFISQHYASSMWTNHEREAAQARAMRENKEYILPVHLDDTEIPSILPTVAYLSLPPETIETIAEAIVAKLREMPNSLLASISQASASGSSKKTKEQWMEEGNAYYKARDNEQALAAYEQVLL